MAALKPPPRGRETTTSLAAEANPRVENQLVRRPAPPIARLEKIGSLSRSRNAVATSLLRLLWLRKILAIVSSSIHGAPALQRNPVCARKPILPAFSLREWPLAVFRPSTLDPFQSVLHPDTSLGDVSRPHDRAVEAAVSAAVPPRRGVRELRGDRFVDVNSEARLVIRIHVAALDLRRTREELT